MNQLIFIGYKEALTICWYATIIWEYSESDPGIGACVIRQTTWTTSVSPKTLNLNTRIREKHKMFNILAHSSVTWKVEKLNSLYAEFKFQQGLWIYIPPNVSLSHAENFKNSCLGEVSVSSSSSLIYWANRANKMWCNSY